MMRFAGIDIGAERHMVAVLDEQGEVLCRSSPFGEDASGYARLFELLGPPDDCLVALEATGHYWRNLFVALIAKDYAVAVVNPLRTALCRGGATAHQDRCDRCTWDRAVRPAETTANGAAARFSDGRVA